MLPEGMAHPGHRLSDRITAPWRRVLVWLACAWLFLIGLFAADWADMARLWWDISTYNHILLVPAIVVWLAWQRAGELSKLVPSGWCPGVVLYAGSALLWVLGAFAGLATARQAGVVAMLVTSAITLLGPRVSAGLAFPLCYMFLLVPFGDELVPSLQMVTAWLTIGLVRLTGIPAIIDGVFIDTPAGLFEVAEACSGVKFLIAMIAFGLLVANVCFKGWSKRVAFMALCLAVPILANGVRAWATIFAAQYVGAQVATGFDHIVYGWIFFAVVLALVIALSWCFFDRSAEDLPVDATRISASPLLNRLERLHIGAAPALALMAALAVAGLGWAKAADALEAPIPQRIDFPAVPGWHRNDYKPQIWWEPRSTGARHRLLGRYADADGNEVDVFFALYSAQREGIEAGGFGEGALPPGGVWAWAGSGPGAPSAKSDRLLAMGRVGRLTETYYRSGTLLTGSNVRLKLANMRDRLLLRERPTMLLVLSAEEREGHTARNALTAFRRSTGPLDEWMDRAAGVR